MTAPTWFRRAVVLPVIVAAVLLGSCSSLPGQPTGPMELTARFDDIGNMRPGHLVKVADVEVGSVTGLELTDDHQALVTMSIDDLDLPVTTRAYIRTTSVLGEKFIELRPPDVAGDDVEMLADGDEIADVGAAPEFEDVVFQLGGVLAAVSGSDLASIIDETDTALDGRADTLSALLVDLRTVTSTFAEQSDTIVRTVVALDELAVTVNDGGGVRQLLVDLDEASALLADNRGRLVEAIDALGRMAQSTQRAVFDPHADAISTQLGQLRRFIDQVRTQQGQISKLLPGLGRFADNAEKIIQGDYINDYIIAEFDEPQVEGSGETGGGG